MHIFNYALAGKRAAKGAENHFEGRRECKSMEKTGRKKLKKT